MNLSTLIAPLLNLASAVKSYGADFSKGNTGLTMAALDRTLGTVASLGLTIGLYRLLKELRDELRDGPKDMNIGASGKNERVLLSIQSLIQALVRGLMMGLGIKRIDSNPTTKDNNPPPWANKMQMRTFSGSCHCKSISFIVSTVLLFIFLFRSPNTILHSALCVCDLRLLFAVLFSPQNLNFHRTTASK